MGAPSTVPEPVVRRQRVLVWDAPTRVFHWALVGAVLTAVVTAQAGGEWMALHGWAGQAVLGLVAFRLVWGLVGASHARFASFVPTPSRLRAYLGGRWRGTGHNPLGALSVLALLALLTLQALSGLFSNDDIAYSGPLAVRISDALSSRLTGLHHQAANGLLVLAGLHIAAIAFHLVIKKDPLLRPMWSGYKEVEHGTSTRPASARALLAALAIGVASVGVVQGVAQGGQPAAPAPPAPPTSPTSPAPLTQQAVPPASQPAASASW